MTKRRRVSVKDRVALFQREGGRCHFCGGLVYPGQAWQLSHRIPIALGGADDESNWGVIHTRPCHEELTRTVDVPAIAKAKRREAKHLGIRAAATIGSRGFTKPIKPSKRLSADRLASGLTELARRYRIMGEGK